MTQTSFATLATLLLLTACASEPPRFVTTGYHPLIERDGEVNIVVDACIQYDALGASDDHFVGTESRLVAESMADNARGYLLQRGIQLKSASSPFFCGALYGTSEEPRRYERTDARIESDEPQFEFEDPPFEPSGDVANDAAYIAALGKVSQFIFNQATDISQDSDAINVFASDGYRLVSQREFEVAAEIVRSKTGKQPLLYIAVNGVKESAGKGLTKAVGQTLLSAVVAVGLASAQASTNPTGITNQGELYRLGGVAPFAIYSPLTHVVEKQAVAGLVDLVTGELVWTKALTRAELKEPNSLDLLLFDVAHKRTNQWTPPGAPQNID